MTKKRSPKCETSLETSLIPAWESGRDLAKHLFISNSSPTSKAASRTWEGLVVTLTRVTGNLGSVQTSRAGQHLLPSPACAGTWRRRHRHLVTQAIAYCGSPGKRQQVYGQELANSSIRPCWPGTSWKKWRMIQAGSVFCTHGPPGRCTRIAISTKKNIILLWMLQITHVTPYPVMERQQFSVFQQQVDFKISNYTNMQKCICQ